MNKYLDAFTAEQRQALHLALLRVKHLPPDAPSTRREGICYLLGRTVDFVLVGKRNAYTIVSELAELWPRHSGDIAYPVPHPGFANPKYAFRQTAKTPGASLWTGPYGANRKELLDFLIDLTEPVKAP